MIDDFDSFLDDLKNDLESDAFDQEPQPQPQPEYRAQNPAPQKPPASPKRKRPLYKRWWFWLIIAVVVIGVVGNLINGGETPAAESAVENQSDEVANPPAIVETPATATETESTEPAFSVVLNWDAPGEYGEEMVLNAGTEVAYTYYAFWLPAGNYRVTNNNGSSAAQISVIDEGTHFTDAGIEEYNYTNGDIVVLFSGDSAEITVGSGQYIKLADGDKDILFEVAPASGEE